MALLGSSLATENNPCRLPSQPQSLLSRVVNEALSQGAFATTTLKLEEKGTRHLAETAILNRTLGVNAVTQRTAAARLDHEKVFSVMAVLGMRSRPSLRTDMIDDRPSVGQHQADKCQRGAGRCP